MQTYPSRPYPYPYQSFHPLRFNPAEREAIETLLGSGDVEVALAEAAFALAERDFDLRLDDHRRLARARRAVLFGLETETQVLSDDVWFAAEWLSGVLIDLAVAEFQVVALFDLIGLPVEAVPHVARRNGRDALPPPPHVLAIAVVASAALARDAKAVMRNADPAFDDADPTHDPDAPSEAAPDDERLAA